MISYKRRKLAMSNWMENQRKKITKKIMVPALAAALAVAAGAYQFAKPSTAAAAAPAQAAPGLDDNSVGALLSLDRAMESLAARVTPAIVNVTVTSKGNARMNMDDGDDQGGTQQFNPFGQFGMPMQ